MYNCEIVFILNKLLVICKRERLGLKLLTTMLLWMIKKTKTIQFDLKSTLVGPLWARAKYSQIYPELLEDFQAIDLIKKIKEKHSDSQQEFEKMENFVDEYYGLAFVNRAIIFDNIIKEYLKKYPYACIINLGCGFDTTYSRVDNGNLTWYNLDLPEVINYRKELIPETSRNRVIPKSIFDFTWFDDIDYDEEKGIFFIAGGLFQYFYEHKVSELIIKMSLKFPKGELIFDNPSRIGIKIINRRFKKQGVEGVTFVFHVGNPKKQFTKLSNNINLVNSFPFFRKMEIKKEWKLKTKLMIFLCNKLHIVKFIHLCFLSNSTSSFLK